MKAAAARGSESVHHWKSKSQLQNKSRNMRHNDKRNQPWGVISTSNLAKKTFNPIRSIIETMNLKPNPKKKMISLSIGDPTVFGNLKPDETVVEAVRKSLDSGNYNGYASSTGYPEARAAVAKHICKSAPGDIDINEEDVILCSGCSCSLDLCISVLCNAGDNILIPRPGFPLYCTLATGLGIEVKEYDLIPECDWEVDLEHMESLIDENTRAIVVNNPSNPCGSVFTPEHLMKILTIAEKNKVPIIADEIYDHFVFPGNDFVPIASLTKTVPILTCGGLTKRFLVPGWRMGWISIHDKTGAFTEVRNGLKSLSQRIIGANTIVQGALPNILNNTPQSFFDDTIATIERNAKVAYDKLSQVPGLKPVMPQGAMYMMVGMDMKLFPAFKHDLEVVESLVKEQSVFCLPGKCFNYINYFRIVLTVPERSMIEACERIEDFCLKYATKTFTQRMAEMRLGTSVESVDSACTSSSGVTSGSDEEDRAVPVKPSQVQKKRMGKRPAPLFRRETVSRLV